MNTQSDDPYGSHKTREHYAKLEIYFTPGWNKSLPHWWEKSYHFCDIPNVAFRLESYKSVPVRRTENKVGFLKRFS